MSINTGHAMLGASGRISISTGYANSGAVGTLFLTGGDAKAVDEAVLGGDVIVISGASVSSVSGVVITAIVLLPG